jgi:LL-diaminopimelate aminotransferase
MPIRSSRRLADLTTYAFSAVDDKVAELKAKGVRVIDFGVGDPTIPTPFFIRKALKKAVDARAASGYPSYVGSPEFRKAVAEWTQRRHGAALDPATEVCASIGAKEAVFHFPEAILDPGEVVLVPTPGYPPYTRGTRFAEGECFYLPLSRDNDYLPDLRKIPAAVLKRARILWINYPNNPTGAFAPDAFFRDAVAFARKHGLILASDEAYSELYYGAMPPRSALEFAGAGSEGVVVFQSFSKRGAMTGWRIGWVAGDARLISLFKKVKTNIDSGTPTFIQDAAIASLKDDRHVALMRSGYAAKRGILCTALRDLGLPDCSPAGTIHVWQEAPRGMTGEQFALRLLAPDIGVMTTPGAWISEPAPNGSNPGARFVRFALVPSLPQVKEAVRRIVRAFGARPAKG